MAECVEPGNNGSGAAGDSPFLAAAGGRMEQGPGKEILPLMAGLSHFRAQRVHKPHFEYENTDMERSNVLTSNSGL